jgi:signal transduction histidine kinase
MSLRIRLAILFGVLVAVILIAMSVFIYFSYKDLRKDAFYKRLEERARITVKLLIDVKEIDQELLRIIDANTIHELYDEKVLIFNASNQIIYSSIDDHKIPYTNELINTIRTQKKISYADGIYDVLGMQCQYSNNEYVVLVSSADIGGLTKVKNLGFILITAVLLGLLLASFAAYYYVKETFKPIELLNFKISYLTVSNLQQKLEVKTGSDELGKLAENFNLMLERLALSFESQKSFVQNASHELRTPLANLTMELDNAINKNLTIDEHKNLLLSFKEDLHNLTSIINSLLFLSKDDQAKFDAEFKILSIDEVLFNAISEVKEFNSACAINFSFTELPENENLLRIRGHERILQSALNNLIDNACKYSDNNSVFIYLSFTPNEIKIEIQNSGQILTEDESKMIFNPFYRGRNSRSKKGFGLGLSIVKRIIDTHNGRVVYSSESFKNFFSVFLPRIV